MLPIAMGNFSGGISEQISGYEKKKRASRIIQGANISFYLITLVWFLMSCITGSLTWRMTENFIIFYTAIVHLWSICYIRQFIKR